MSTWSFGSSGRGGTFRKSQLLEVFGWQKFLFPCILPGRTQLRKATTSSCLTNPQARSSFASGAGTMQWGKAMVSDRLLSDRLLSDRQTSSSDTASGSGKLHPYQQMCLYCKYPTSGAKKYKSFPVLFSFFRIFVRTLMTIQCSLSGYTRSTSVLSYYRAFGWLPSFLICKQGCCKQAAFSGCGFIPSWETLRSSKRLGFNTNSQLVFPESVADNTTSNSCRHR